MCLKVIIIETNKLDTRVGQKVHMMLYMLFMTLTYGVQALQQWKKKCVDCKGDYIEK